jgi:hypothetical protein
LTTNVVANVFKLISLSGQRSNGLCCKSDKTILKDFDNQMVAIKGAIVRKYITKVLPLQYDLALSNKINQTEAGQNFRLSSLELIK